MNPNAPPVHRYWTGRPHPLADFTNHALMAMAPGYVINWNDATLPAECLEEVAQAEGKVRPEDAIRHRCNVIRWWLLHNYGGYTVHHDVILLKPLDDLPYPMTAAHFASRCTSVLAYPHGHPIPLRMLEEIRRAPLSDTASSPEVSGEAKLTLIDPETPSLRYPWDKLGRYQVNVEQWAIVLRFPKERYRENVGSKPTLPPSRIVAATIEKPKMPNA